MTRDELIDAAAQALADDRYGAGVVVANTWHRNMAAPVVDAVVALLAGGDE